MMNDFEFTKFVAETLYKYDPANLDCVANEMFNEYESEADAFMKLFAEYMFMFSVKSTLNEVFVKKFGTKHYDIMKLMNAAEEIQEARVPK